jgi:endo-1,3(4)-beta-glucanase
MNVVFSAEEMSEDGGEFAVSDMGPFSVNTELSVGDGSIKLPIALGMGFVTAEYNGLTPKLTSQLGFKSLEKKDLSSEDKQKRDTPTYTNVTVANNSYATTDDSDSGSSANINKYVVELNNNPTKWVIYVSSPDGKPATLKKDKDGSSIVAEGKSDNVVFQVGVLPSGADAQMDKTAGTYPTKASLSANVTGGDVGVYSIDYETKGSSAANAPFIWALPHHVDSFTDEMADAETEVYLVSGTKGIMSGFASNRLIMSEQLHTDIQFLPVPVNSTDSKDVNYSDEVKDRIAKAAKEELSQNMTGQVDIAATYTAGKAFDKYAYIALVVNDILQNNESSKSALDQLKQAFSIWTKNEQPLPLLYDTRYKGIISSAAQDGDTGADFGNPYYNDHHFHYGYFIHAAAIIGHIDKQQGGNWIEENKDWVNNLVRDVANPSDEDTHFPVFRMFDFYHGHSWAHGMFASSGGKDEESTSEDINFAYGMKLWGNVIGDKKMEARGDLMIAIMKRSLDAYFYLKDDNGNQPKNFIKNKVAGITFENQVDHTTYFGTKLEYIQGIHMIPMTPVSAIVRTPEFVQQEWDQKIKGILDDVEDGWSGILRINQAIIDPKSSYEYFTSDDFDTQKQLDGGASLTWYLAYSAGMNGGSV